MPCGSKAKRELLSCGKMLKSGILLNTIFPPCQVFYAKFTKYFYLRNDSHLEIEMKIEIIMIMRSIIIYKAPHKMNNNRCKLSQW